MVLLSDPEQETVDFFDKKREEAALQILLNDMLMMIK